MQIVNVLKSRIALAVLVLLTGAGIAGIILFKHSTKRTISVTSLVQEAAQTTSFENKNTNLIKDSDNDGLLDWEEKVYGTDPNSPDTDGDGTPDGEEINQHRDPKLPGPNDSVTSQPTAVSVSGNLTELLAQELSGVLNNPKITPTRNNVEEVLANIDVYSSEGFKKTFAGALTVNREEFDLSNIPESTVQISNAPGVGERYLQSVSFIFEKRIAPLPKNLSEALFSAIANAEYETLDAYVSAYQTAAAEIQTLPVPLGWGEAQRKQIAMFLTLSRITRAVQEARTDPLKSSLALAAAPRILAVQGEIAEEIWRNSERR